MPVVPSRRNRSSSPWNVGKDGIEHANNGPLTPTLSPLAGRGSRAGARRVRGVSATPTLSLVPVVGLVRCVLDVARLALHFPFDLFRAALDLLARVVRRFADLPLHLSGDVLRRAFHLIAVHPSSPVVSQRDSAARLFHRREAPRNTRAALIPLSVYARCARAAH